MYDETIDVKNAEEVRSPTPESPSSSTEKQKQNEGDLLHLARAETISKVGFLFGIQEAILLSWLQFFLSFFTSF